MLFGSTPFGRGLFQRPPEPVPQSAFRFAGRFPDLHLRLTTEIEPAIAALLDLPGNVPLKVAEVFRRLEAYAVLPFLALHRDDLRLVMNDAILHRPGFLHELVALRLELLE